jgi:hypothetical protein
VEAAIDWLLEQLLDWPTASPDRGGAWVSVAVLGSSPKGQKVYERLGFERSSPTDCSKAPQRRQPTHRADEPPALATMAEAVHSRCCGRHTGIAAAFARRKPPSSECSRTARLTATARRQPPELRRQLDSVEQQPAPVLPSSAPPESRPISLRRDQVGPWRRKEVVEVHGHELSHLTSHFVELSMGVRCPHLDPAGGAVCLLTADELALPQRSMYLVMPGDPEIGVSHTPIRAQRPSSNAAPASIAAAAGAIARSSSTCTCSTAQSRPRTALVSWMLPPW